MKTHTENTAPISGKPITGKQKAIRLLLVCIFCIGSITGLILFIDYINKIS